MSIDPLATARLGTTDVDITRLGLGTSPLGGWPEAVTADEGRAAIESAWANGLRYFDTAPFYGFGQSEIWLGDVLQRHERSSYVVSTKVGRLLRPRSSADPPPMFQGARPFDAVFDFSYDGTMRSFESSLERLRIDRIDIALIHDPDDSLCEALDGAYAALAELRDAGIVRAIGAGMNFPAPLAFMIDRADLDCALLAGRYTLLDQVALDELLPLAEKRNVPIIAGGVFNSGILANPRPGATFDYAPASAEVLERATQLEEICDSFGVPLAAAALQFPLGHPAVAAVVTGARSQGEVHENVQLMRTQIPAELWDTLTENGLLRADAPRRWS
jgi:D-threo-aldose 1-dehydrogenase